MIGTLGEVLPYALGIALSPISVIAAVLLLMSPRPRPLGLTFLTGWFAGVLIAVALFVLLSEFLPDRNNVGGAQPIRGIIQLVLGGVLLALAVRRWRSRPKPGEEARLPKWMSAIDAITSVGALRLALLLSAVSPKNLVICAAAGTTIGYSLDGVGAGTAAVISFAVIASVGVGTPVLGHLIAPQKVGAVLEGIRAWLTGNNAIIMSVLMLILGVQLLGKSIANLTG